MAGLKSIFRESGDIPGSKQVLALLLVIMTATGFFSMKTLDAGHDWGDDFALYVMQAHALRSGTLGELKRNNRFAMEHSVIRPGPDLYPPGYPFLMAPWCRDVVPDLMPLKKLNVFFLVACIPVFFLILQRRLKDRWHLALILVLVFGQYEILSFPDQVLSELPFLFFVLLSLGLMERAHRTTGKLLLGASMFAAFMIRDAGVILPVALLAREMGMRSHLRGTGNRQSQAFSLFTFLLLSLTAHLAMPATGHYHLNKLLHETSGSVLAENGNYYMQAWMQLLCKYDTLFIRTASVLLMICGCYFGGRKDMHLTVTLAGLLLLALLWPVQMGYRMLIPAFPLMIYFMVLGFLGFARKLRVKRAVVLTVAIGCIFIVVYRNAEFLQERIRAGSNEALTPEMQQIYAYIRLHVPEQDVIGFEKPRALTLFTGRPSIHTDPGHFNAGPAQWILVRKDDTRELKAIPVMETAHCLLLKKETDSDRFNTN